MCFIKSLILFLISGLGLLEIFKKKKKKKRKRTTKTKKQTFEKKFLKAGPKLLV